MSSPKVELAKVFAWNLLVEARNWLHSPSLETPLVIAMAGIGDLLFSTALIRKLHQISRHPIDIVTFPLAASILEGNPHIGHIYLLDKNASPKAHADLSKQLNVKNYSVVFSIRTPVGLLQRYGLWGQHGIWIRHPFFFEELRLWQRIQGRISQERKRAFYQQMHIIERDLSMIPESSNWSPEELKLEIFPTPSAQQEIQTLLSANWGQTPFVVIHVAGQDPIRKLRVDTFREVVRQFSLPVILVGAPNDVDVAEAIRQGHDHVMSQAGKLSLMAVFALLQKTVLCIAPDSSIMHMAVTAKAPLVALVGNQRPETFGPFPRHERIIVLDRQPECSPCSRLQCDKFPLGSCVQDITATEIVSAAKKLLKPVLEARP